MRRVTRPNLTDQAKKYLAKRHLLVFAAVLQGSVDIEKHWKPARKTKTVKEVLVLLQKSMGPTERCMYCVDSHGSDIEHFWPKAHYPLKAFDWSNWLLCCTECGRYKGTEFPLSPQGTPMLVDPTVEDPWDFLDFDPDTGNITGRYDVAANAINPRGHETAKALQLYAREGLAEGYKRTFERLAEIVEQSTTAGAINVPDLVTRLQKVDDHSLAAWCFTDRGARTEPFKTLHRLFPGEWTACVAALS